MKEKIKERVKEAKEEIPGANVYERENYVLVTKWGEEPKIYVCKRCGHFCGTWDGVKYHFLSKHGDRLEWIGYTS